MTNAIQRSRIGDVRLAQIVGDTITRALIKPVTVLSYLRERNSAGLECR
jgi:hypothetical protein